MSRESGIEKRIELVFNLGNYESVRMSASFSEKINWKDSEERAKKTKKITELLVNEIKRDVENMSKDLCVKQRLIDYSQIFELIYNKKGNGSNEEIFDSVKEDEDFRV